MTYEELKALSEQRLEKNPKIQSLLEKIVSGTANLSDTAEYSNLVSSILSYTVKRNIADIENAEEITDKLLHDHYEHINSILAQVQSALDNKNGLHIKPQKAVFPKERVNKFSHSLIDPTVPFETIQRRAGSGIETICRSFHDDYIKANAEVRHNAGLKCYIVRTSSGKCCDWCKRIAGRYVYGSEPKDVYRRHDNCDCTCIFENGRQRQDVWSPKKWEVKETPKEKFIPKSLTPQQARQIQSENLRYKGLTSDGNNGIIKSEGDRKMNLIIDKFTPCLENTETGELVPTVYERASRNDLLQLKGWNFNWLDKELEYTEIYKLCVASDKNIQGLVAVTDFKRDMAVYVNIAESAPHNLGKNKKFNGVGGHLFAIAAKISFEKGYGGFLFMDAKNTDLVKHYSKTLNAVLLGRPHPYRMFIDEENAMKLLDTYTFEEG